MIADFVALLFMLPFIVGLWLALYYGFKWLQKNWNKV